MNKKNNYEIRQEFIYKIAYGKKQEIAFYIKDIYDIYYLFNSNLFNKIDRVYFGNEFCERLIPSLSEVKSIILLLDGKKPITFLTPYVINSYNLIEQILDILPKNSEVVFNDYGILELIKSKELVPVLGRLLVKQKKDPLTLSLLNKSDFKDYFKQTNINSEFQWFLVKNNVFRIELDNVTQGFNIRLRKEIKASIYFPFVYITTTRKCLMAGLDNKIKDYQHNPEKYNKINKIFVAKSCNYECNKYIFKYKLSIDLTKDMFLNGNTLFYMNDDINILRDNIKSVNIDRIVLFKDIPQGRSLIDLWNNYYMKNKENFP